MNHEGIPMSHAQRRAELTRFYRIVVPETRPTARTALSNMLDMGTLRQSSATRLLQDFWQEPDEYFSNICETWRAKRAE
jgi:hypothetical protein